MGFANYSASLAMLSYLSLIKVGGGYSLPFLFPCELVVQGRSRLKNGTQVVQGFAE
jgi:hypothetical protein